jgi:hypothetical protein
MYLFSREGSWQLSHGSEVVSRPQVTHFAGSRLVKARVDRSSGPISAFLVGLLLEFFEEGIFAW